MFQYLCENDCPISPAECSIEAARNGDTDILRNYYHEDKLISAAEHARRSANHITELNVMRWVWSSGR